MSILSFTKKIQGSRQGKGADKKTEKKAPAKKKGASSKIKVKSVRSLKIGLAPIVTEKSVLLQEGNVMAFRVNQKATKGQVAEAVASLYGVKARKVRLMTVNPKRRRRGNVYGRTKSWKKAYVQVDDVQSLNVGP